MTRKSYDDDFDHGVTDVLETPGKDRTQWADDAETPAPGTVKRTRASAGSKGGVNLTLRDQEKVRVSHPVYNL